MTTSKLNQAEFAVKVKRQRDSIDYLINEIKRLVAYRYWPESSYGDKHELFLDELSKTEAQIEELKSQADFWINMQNKDISQIERNISRANGVREKRELENMNDTKKSEIKFLQQQISRLKDTFDYLKKLINEKQTHAYFYSYRLERNINHGSYHPCSVDAEELYITAHPSKFLLKLKIHLPDKTRRELEDEKRHLRAFLKKDNTVFISRSDAYPRKLGIGTLLLKVLESQLSPGTEISLEAEGDSPTYWQKMGFSYELSTAKYYKRSNL
ncbi:hypothetical protein [Microcoleus sp. herbarium2]|uniref:hypothetical protein n=1 Tax=Microcoleus sp. herbarium2 TaxID=3055433 RepID=UPI002FD1A6E6